MNENEANNFALRLYIALEDILQDKRAFYEPGTSTLRLKDVQNGFIKEINVDPRDLVCVYSPLKSRLKYFIIREDLVDNKGNVRDAYTMYSFDNNDYNFESLRAELDPISRRLVQISRRTIVNVGYYNLSGKEAVKLSRDIKQSEGYSEFNITMNGALELFSAIQMHFNEDFSLQKRIIDYMNQQTGNGRP